MTLTAVQNRFTSINELMQLNGTYNEIRIVSEDPYRDWKDACVDLNRELRLDARVFRIRINHICRRPGDGYYIHWWNPSDFDKSRSRLFFTICLTQQYRNKEETAADITVTPTDYPIESAVLAERFNRSSYNYHGIGLGSDWTVYCVVKLGDYVVPVLMDPAVAELAFGMEITEDAKIKVGEKVFDFPKANAMMERDRYGDMPLFDVLTSATSQNNLLRHAMKTKDFPKQALKGIQKVWKKVQGFAEEIKVDEPLSYLAFRAFVSQANKTIDKVRMSTLFNTTFKDVTDKDSFLAAIKPLRGVKVSSSSYYSRYSSDDRYFHNIVKELPAYKEIRKKTLKSTTNRAFNKLMQDKEFVNVQREKFPLTFEAIENGDIPIGTFFRKKEQYFLLNDNWELWEEMLRKHREVTISLAKEVSTRTTYEKDLMSYFFFILHTLPEYLQTHTGRKWICKPKLINQSSELEKDEEVASGKTSKRSAMTPTVDNEAGIVTVPFISVCMAGYRSSTWCYAHNYVVLTRGYSHDGNVVMRDLEKALNGKDDYGLMFYTLIGTPKGTGNPTFLIIFERLATGTRVHFHRVHPSRSKDGDYNPIHAWTKNCYNWMAGNVRRDRIETSQGDLMFLKVDEDAAKKLVFDGSVNNYDSHTFEKAVGYAEPKAKKAGNLLGHIKLDGDVWLRHPEHEDRLLPEGAYEIRQARSFEANPSGSWSMTID